MTSLESLGSNMSLIAWMDTFRIDIVVSEFGKSERKKSRSANKNKSGNSLLFNFIQNVFKIIFYFSFCNFYIDIVLQAPQIQLIQL